MTTSAVLDAARAQAQLARGLWADRRFRAPMLTIWVATFGSSLHGPVTTFFYLRVGASARDVGALNAIITGVAVAVAPLWGVWQDRARSARPMRAAAALCAAGCAVRGAASSVGELYAAAAVLGLGGVNLWTAVLAHVCHGTPQPFVAGHG